MNYPKNCYTCKKKDECWFYAKAAPLITRCDKFRNKVGKYCKAYDTTYITVIKKNAICCKKCQQVIESKHVHDFVTCLCGAVSVDGGREYMKLSGNLEDMIDKSEWEYLTPEEYEARKQKRIQAQKKAWENIDPELLLAIYDKTYNWEKKI